MILNIMAVQLSVTGSVVGIVSLEITVPKGLLDYYNTLKDQDKDITSMKNQLRRLHTILIPPGSEDVLQRVRIIEASCTHIRSWM